MIQWSDKQTEKLADIMSGLGHTAFASVALPVIISKADPFAATAGLGMALLCWTFSLVILDKVNNI